MTLPVNRKIIVRSRFVLILISLSVGIILGTIITLAGSALLYGRTIVFEHTFIPSLDFMLLIICTSILACGIINLPSLPILLKIGYIKGKLIGFYLPSFGMFALIVVTVMLINRVEAFREFILSVTQWALSNIVWTSVMLMIAAVIVFAASYILSQRVYAKREF